MDIHLYKHKAIKYDLLSDEDDIVGGVIATDYIEFVELSDLFINTEYQNNKFATHLIKTALEDNKGKLICLECNPFNTGLNKDQLHNWYIKLGFVDGSSYHSEGEWMSKNNTI